VLKSARLQVTIQVAAIALGMLLVIWRASIDWQQLSQREMLDTVRGALFIALGGQCFTVTWNSNTGKNRLLLAAPRSLLAGAIALAIGATFLIGGYSAYVRLESHGSVPPASTPTSNTK
jgi:hypothetical protein